MAKQSKGNKDSNKGNKESASKDDGEVAFTFDVKEIDTLMTKAVEAMKAEFDKLRTGQASASMLDHVKVKAYGNVVPLAQVGQVALRDGKTLVVNVFDPSVIKAIETGIRDCGMNLNPVVEEKIIRVPLPKMTKEFRDSLAKTTKTMGESAKMSVRRARQKGMDTIKKAGKKVPADEARKLEKKIQELHDQYVKTIEDLIQKKTKAIMQ